jgi:tetratricopeptide (TPR) repeat protein
MLKLFVSYAHLDSEIVTSISNELREAGYDVWMDIQGIQGGDLWVEKITQAIIDCDVFLLFLSPRSIKSDHVRRELDLAFEEGKKILPLRLEKAEIPIRWRYQLAGIQYIDHQTDYWKSRVLIALSEKTPIPSSGVTTDRLKNPFSSRPVLEPTERRLILSNREEELTKAIQYMDDHRLLLVTGMHGIGKSTFACALLDFRSLDSADVFWYDFERQKSSGNTLGVLLDRISSYLDITFNVSAREKVMAFRETRENASVSDVDILIGFLNQEEPVWLVFDNLETVLSTDTQEFLDDGLALLFDSLKNTNHNAKIIITNPFVPILKTGELLLEVGTQPLALHGMDITSSVALLRAYGLGEISTENQELLERKVNGHPFVLNQTGHYIQSLGGGETNLGMILEDVTERFADSLKKRLSEQEFAALQFITVLNREMQLNGLCQITQAKPSVIMHLREKGMLEANNSGYFWLHSIVRSSSKLTDPILIKKAHMRAMDFYRRQPIPSFRQNIDAYANVLEWHHHAVDAGDVISAYSALYKTGLKEQLMEWNEYDLLINLCEQTLTSMYQVEADLSQVQANLSNIEQIRIYHTLGNIFFLLGEYPKSIANLARAIKLLEPQGDDELRIRLMIDLSESYNGNRNVAETMKLLQQLTSHVNDISDDLLLAKFLHLQGIVNRDNGNVGESIGNLQEALRLYEKHNKAVNVGNARIDLGIAFYYQNQIADALVNYQLARISFEAQGDMRGMIIARYNIAEIMLQKEEFRNTMDEVQPALQIARKRKFVELELRTGLLLVEAQIALSLLDEAGQELKKLNPLIAARESKCLSGQELVLQAYQQSKQNKPEQATKCFVQAMKLLQSPDCDYEYARGCLIFAGFLKEQGEFKHARDELSTAGTIFTQINNQLGLQAVQKMVAALPDP